MVRLFNVSNNDIYEINFKRKNNMEKIIILSLFLFLSCITNKNEKAEPSIYYKRDIQMNINGFDFDGTGVVKKSDKYKFKIKAKGNLDLFIMATCHREITSESAWTKKLFVDKKEASFEFIPNEIEFDCPLNLLGAEIIKGRHSWGFVDFESNEYILPAINICNGEKINSNGVSVCQSKQGLIEEIRFEVEVFVSPVEQECQTFLSNSGNIFKYNIPENECVYLFVEKQKPHRKHKLSTIGYQDVLLRSE